MRAVILSVGAAGSSPWCPVNQLQNAFGIGLGAAVTSGASLTYTVQHTFDDPGPQGRRLVSVSRSGTVATVVDNDHRLSVNDAVLITGTGSAVLDSPANTFGSSYQPATGLIPWDVASVIDANTYTYTVANSGPTTDQGNTNVYSARVYPHSTMANLTARADGNYQYNVQAIRLRVTAWVSGKVDLTILQGMGN
jgi:hypothetical protein